MPESTTVAPVQVVDYDPDWPRIFSQLKDQIWPSLRYVALAIEHVGSTSVPGLAAKPVIDIDIVIASRTDLPLLIQRLGALGYQHRGNLGIEDRDAFRAPENQPAQHLYVCVENSLALQNHIAVRDYLRTHACEATAYSTLKKQLAEQFRNDRECYMAGKTAFILSILKRCDFSAGALDSIKQANQIKC
jgi:GrpB-like predicted nucleotidyltransferase (UPF0157 family)